MGLIYLIPRKAERLVPSSLLFVSGLNRQGVGSVGDLRAEAVADTVRMLL